MPVEVSIAGVFMSPLMVCAILGYIAALGTSAVMNRTRVTRYFAHPASVFLSITVIYTVLIGTFILPF